MRIEGNVTAISEIYQVSRSTILEKNEPTMELLYEGTMIAVESHQFFILDVPNVFSFLYRLTQSVWSLSIISRGGGIVSACPFV